MESKVDTIPTSEQSPVTRSKKLHRISGDDFHVTKDILFVAALTLQPDRTQRRAFGELMPTLHMLHENEGFDFKQITMLLNDCGFKLSANTVRMYYREFLQNNEAEYLAQIGELTLQFNEVKKARDVRLNPKSNAED